MWRQYLLIIHLFHIGHQICEQEQLDFSILKPLILETINKIQYNTPYDMQTGPARRGDQQTIQKHLGFLEDYSDYQELYSLLSKRIEDSY